MKALNSFVLYLLFFTVILFRSSYNNSLYQDINTNLTLAQLIVPKIDIKMNIYDYTSELNNVDKNIYLASFNKIGSGAIVLASHSGNSPISYFKNLNKLIINDSVFIEDDENIYEYSVDKIYKISKNGKFTYNNFNNMIYLVTCDQSNKKKQLVVQASLVNTTKKSSII